MAHRLAGRSQRWPPARNDRGTGDIRAWKTSISASNPIYLENLTQFYATPEFWHLTK
jgi:hypothetical protein